MIPKYFNTKTGEICFNFREVLHSIKTDLKYYPKAYTWVLNWVPYKN